MPGTSPLSFLGGATNPVGLGLTAAGVLGGLGLFGGGGQVKNPYGGQATSDYNAADKNFTQQSDYGTNLGNYGQSLMTQGQNFAPTQQAGLTSYLGALTANPYTDTFATAQFSRANSGATQGYQAARANLESQLGARGMASPGGNSSMLAGGLAGIDAAAAGNSANLKNSLALDAYNQRLQNLGMANQAAAGYAQQLYGQGVGATEGGAGIVGSAGQNQLQAGNEWSNFGQQQTVNSAAAQQNSASNFGGLGSLGGYILGGGAGGAASAIPGAMSMVAPSGGSSPYSGQLMPQNYIGAPAPGYTGYPLGSNYGLPG